MNRHYLSDSKQKLFCGNYIIFYGEEYEKYHLLEIFDMITHNQKLIKITSEQQVKIKRIHISQDQAYLVLRFHSQNKKEIIHIIQLANNLKFPIQSFLIDSFDDMKFYSKNICVISSEKEVYILDIFNHRKKQILIESNKIRKVIIGDFLNIIIVMCQQYIWAVWMKQGGQDMKRKIKKVGRNAVLDLIVLEQKLYLMKRSEICRVQMSYFDDSKQKFLVNIMDDQFQMITCRKQQDRLEILALSRQYIYFIDLTAKNYINIRLSNCIDGKIIPLQNQNVVFYSLSGNYIEYINKKDKNRSELNLDIDTSKSKRNSFVQSNNNFIRSGRQMIAGGIRLESKQKQIINIQKNLKFQATPSLFSSDKKSPIYFGSQYIQFNSSYNIYISDNRQKTYLEIDDVQIPIRQIYQDSKSFIPQIQLEQTAQTRKKLKNIIMATKLHVPILLEGEAGCGKTAIVQYLAKLTNTPLFRINLNSFTDISDILGKSNINHKNQIKFTLSNFTTALQKGYWVLLDEANLSKDQVLNVIQHLFSLSKICIVNSAITGNIDQVNGVLNVRRHPGFQLFLAQNPGGDRYSSRNIFSESFMSNMICLKFSQIPFKELQQIIFNKLSKTMIKGIQIFSKQQAQLISKEMIEIYNQVKQYEKKQRSISNLTIRDLLQISDIFASCELDPESLAGSQSIKLCFIQTLDEKDHKISIEKYIDSKSKFKRLSNNCRYYQKLKRLNIELTKSDEDILFSFCDLCHVTKKPGLMYSPQSSGKLSLLLKWAKIRGMKKQDIIIVNLTKQTQVQDLYGKTYINDDPKIKAKYIFKDGPVKKAIKEGKILILRGLDKVQAAVSQSLNGILQTGKTRAVCIYEQYIQIQQSTLIFATASISKLRNATNLSPALLSRFFSISQPSNISQQDLKIIINNQMKNFEGESYRIIQALKINLHQKTNDKIVKKIEIIKSQAFFYLEILNKFFNSQVLRQFFDQKQLKNLLISHLNFFSMIAKYKKINIRGQDKLIFPFDYAKLMREDYTQKLSFTMTPSRTKVANAIAFCIACKIPIILQGKSGIGKSKIIDLVELFKMYNGLKRKKKIISINKATTINDLMGSIKLTKQQAIVQTGPLKTAMIDGMIVLLDQFNLANSSVLSFVEQLLRYPESIIDPITGSLIEIHKNFRILAAQNPSSYAGRQSLPDSILNKVILIDVPLYSKSQIVDICKGKLQEKLDDKEGVTISKEKIEFLVNLFAYVDDESALQSKSQQFKKKCKNTTLRLYIKLCKRLRKLHLSSKDALYLDKPNWKEFIQLNASLVFPEETLSQYITPIKSISFNQIGRNIRFKVSSKYCELNFELPLNINNSHLIEKIKDQPPQFQLTLFNLMLCKFFNENALLVGQTSHKTTVVTNYFSKIIRFQLTSNPLTTIYLSNLTEMSEIYGSIEPHTYNSYRKYLKTRMQYLDGKTFEDRTDNIQKQLQNYKHIFHQKEWKNFSKFLKEKDQFFTICQRNIMPAIRYGGIAFLQNINLPEQSKIQGLNSLFEIDQSFTFDNQELKIHKQFMVIATVHLPTYLQLSPAFRSRFCIINIKCHDFLEKLRQNKKKIFKSSIQQQFAIKFIEIFKQIKPDRYRQLNQKHLHNWLRFQDLQLKKQEYNDEGLAKLVIGAQILFIENLQIRPINFQQKIRLKIIDAFKYDYKIRSIFEKLENFSSLGRITQTRSQCTYLKYMGIKINKHVQISDFIFSKTAIRNIFRILCAFYTKLNLNLKGPPGIGKTAICEIVCRMTGRKFIRICCSESMQLQDLFGSYIPIMNNNSIQFFFQMGKVLEALSNQKIEPLILFDEINLAPSDVLSGLVKIFNSGEEVVRIKDYKMKKGKALFICAMNPPSIGGGRKELPEIITNQLCPINLDNLSTEELSDIVIKTSSKKINRIYQKNLPDLLGIHKYLQKYQPNIRHFQNIAAVLQTFNLQSRDKDIQKYYCALTALLVYSGMTFKNQKVKKQVQQEIVKRYGFRSYQKFSSNLLPLQIYIQSGFIYMKRNNQLILKKSRQNGNNSFQNNPPLKYTLRTKLMLEKMLLAFQSKRILLIEGEKVSGKTSLALQMVRLTNQPYLYFCLNYQNQIYDFLGGICPTDETQFSISSQNKSYLDLIDQLTNVMMKLHHEGKIKIGKITKQFSIKQIYNILNNCQRSSQKEAVVNLLKAIEKENCKQPSGGVKFKFNKGIIRYAMKEGYILILDNIDLAKPVVIERFNSLGQEGGKLHINQVGAAESDDIHPNFRIICIANQKRSEANELSQAFKNRVIKIQMEEEYTNENYDSHITAILNSDTQPDKKCKHHAFEYKLADCIKTIYKKVHKKEYRCIQQQKVKGFTINQKSIVNFKRLTARYGIQNTLPVSFSFIKDIEKDQQVMKIINISAKLKLQRPKIGVSQKKIFQSISQTQKVQNGSIRSLKDLAKYITTFGSSIFHKQLSSSSVAVRKQKVDSFDSGDMQIFKVLDTFNLKFSCLDFLNLTLEQVSIHRIEKNISLKCSCQISKCKFGANISNNFNQNYASIKMDISKLQLQSLHQVSFLKGAIKLPFKQYLPSLIQAIQKLPYTAQLYINYKAQSSDIKLSITFKNTIKLFDFFQIKDIKCQVQIKQKSLYLHFTLMRNGASLGDHKIQLSSSEKILKYTNKFQIGQIFKMVQIPSFFNILPITNIQLIINFSKNTGEIRFFSSQIIKSLSTDFYSLRNPNIQLRLKDSKLDICIEVDLYFKDTLIIRLNQDIVNLVKKSLEINEFSFLYQKNEKNNFDISKQIIPIFKEFKINQYILNLITKFLEKLSSIYVKFQRNKDNYFILDVNLKFLLNKQANKQASIFKFNTIQLQFNMDTENSVYQLFVGGTIQLDISRLSTKQIKLDFGVDMSNKSLQSGLNIFYTFDPPIKTLSDIAGIVIDKQKINHITLDSFNLQKTSCSLKKQIAQNLTNNICNIRDGNFHLKYQEVIKQRIQPFGFTFIQFEDIVIKASIMIPSFKYQLLLSGSSIFFKGLQVQFILKMNNNQWTFKGNMIKNTFSFNKVLSSLLGDNIDISALNNTVSSIRKADYDIKKNLIDLSLGINIGIDLKLFSIEQGWIQYKGIIGEQTTFRISVLAKMFSQQYVFYYDYKQGFKLPSPKEINLKYIKENFALSQILPQSQNTNFVLAKNLINKIHIGLLQFQFLLSNTYKMKIMGNLQNGKLEFSFGGINITLLTQKLYLQFTFQKPFKFAYGYQIKASLSINNYQLGRIHINGMPECPKRQIKYQFNKINTKQLFKKLIQKEISILPQIVEIDMKNSDILTQGFDCKLFQFELKFPSIDIISNLCIKNCRFHFVYDKLKPSLLEKISNSNFSGSFWFKTLQLFSINGIIKGQGKSESLLELKIKSSENLRLSKFFQVFLDSIAPTQLDKIQLSFKLEMYYFLFNDKARKSNIKDYTLQLTSNFKAFEIWSLFKLQSVAIKLQKQRWLLLINLCLFNQSLQIKYQNGEFVTVNKAVFEFNKIVQCVSSSLAKIFHFKMVLQTFKCDFGNYLYILMKSPQKDGQWVIMEDSNKKKLIYLNKLKFELTFNKSKKPKQLFSLEGSFFIGTQQVVKIIYYLGDDSTKEKISINKSIITWFNIKQLLQQATSFNMDFFPPDFSANIFKIHYDDKQSKTMLGADKINKIYFGVKIKNFSLNILPFENKIQEATLNLVVNRNEKGIKKVHGSFISGDLSICGLKLSLYLKIDETIEIKAKSRGVISLAKLLSFLLSQQVDLFQNSFNLESYELLFILQRNKQKNKYQFKSFKCLINAKIMVIDQGNIKLQLKTFQVIKQGNSPITLFVEIDLFGNQFKVGYAKNKIMFMDSKQSKEINMMKILDQKNDQKLNAQIKSFQITRNKQKQFFISLGFTLDKKQSSLQIIYSPSKKTFLGMLESEYFPWQYLSILKFFFGVENVKTSGTFIKGSIKAIDSNYLNNEKLDKNIIKRYIQNNYSRMLRIQSQITINNVITRFLNKEKAFINLYFQNNSLDLSPTVEILLGPSYNLFQSEIVPSEFQTKCIIQKDFICFNINAKDQDCQFLMKISRQKTSFFNSQQYSLSLKLEFQHLFDIFYISTQFIGKLKTGKDFQLSAQASIQLKIIPLDNLTVKAAAKVSVAKKKFGFEYIAFSVQNLSLGLIIQKICRVDDKFTLSILSWLPVVKKIQLLDGSSCNNFRGDQLPKNLVESGYPSHVYPFHRFCNCQLFFLGTNIKFMFQISIKRFALQFKIDSISFFSGRITIGAFEISAALEVPSFNNIDLAKIGSSLRNMLSQIKMQAKSQVNLKIFDIINTNILIDISQSGFIAKLLCCIFGISLSLQIVFNSSGFRINGKKDDGCKQTNKNDYYQQFKNRCSKIKPHKDQQVEKQMKNGYTQSFFSLTVKQLQFQLKCSSSSASIYFKIDLNFMGFHINRQFKLQILFNQSIISKFLKKIFDLVWPDWFNFWKTKCQEQVESRRQGKKQTQQPQKQPQIPPKKQDKSQQHQQKQKKPTKAPPKPQKKRQILPQKQDKSQQHQQKQKMPTKLSQKEQKNQLIQQQKEQKKIKQINQKDQNKSQITKSAQNINTKYDRRQLQQQSINQKLAIIEIDQDKKNQKYEIKRQNYIKQDRKLIQQYEFNKKIKDQSFLKQQLSNKQQKQSPNRETNKNYKLPQIIRVSQSSDLEIPPSYTLCYCKKSAKLGTMKESCGLPCQSLLKCKCICSKICHDGQCVCEKPMVPCFCKKKSQMHEQYDCLSGCSMKRSLGNCKHQCEQKQCHQYCKLECKEQCLQLLECGQCTCKNTCGTCKNGHQICKISKEFCYCGKTKKHSIKTCGSICQKKKINCGHFCDLQCHTSACLQCEKQLVACFCGRQKQICQSQRINTTCKQKCLKHLSKCGHPCRLQCHFPNEQHRCSVIISCFCKSSKVYCFARSCNKICRKKLCLHKTCQRQCHDGKCINQQTKFDCNKKCDKQIACGHKCRLKCNHNGPCICQSIIQKPCRSKLHKITYKCGQLQKPCSEKCKQVYKGCGHKCQRQCSDHSQDANARHSKCLQQITYQLKCYQHDKTKISSGFCYQIKSKKYSCMAKCNTILLCSHICQLQCHSGGCLCTSSRCTRCSKETGAPCQGTQKFCNKPCSKDMKCGHKCKIICHAHNSEEQQCQQLISIQCICKNHSNVFKCSEGFSGKCPQQAKQQAFNDSKKNSYNKFKIEIVQIEKVTLLNYHQKTQNLSINNKIQSDQAIQLPLVPSLFRSAIELNKPNIRDYISQLLQQYQNLNIKPLDVLIVIDISFQMISEKVYNLFYRLMQVVNLTSTNVQIIVSGDIRYIVPYYLKKLQEPLNINKILEAFNLFATTQRKTICQQARQCKQPIRMNQLSSLICFTNQNLPFEKQFAKQIQQSKMNSSIFLIDSQAKTHQLNRSNSYQEVSQNILCRSFISSEQQNSYCYRQAIFQTADQIGTEQFRKSFQQNKVIIFNYWKELPILQEQVKRIAYKKAVISELDESKFIIQKILPQRATESVQYQQICSELKAFFSQIIEESVNEIRRTSPDIFTKYAFSNSGLITEKSIIKAQSTNYTTTQFYEKRIAGPKHFKPTYFIFDLTSTSHSTLLSSFMPVILNLIFTLDKIGFSYGILTITSNIKCIKLLNQRFQPARLFQAFYEAFQARNNFSKLCASAIYFAVNQLKCESKNFQSSVILISNSLHLLPIDLLGRIEEETFIRKINLSVITFMKYRALPLCNVYYLSCYKQITKIFKNFYVMEEVQQQIMKKKIIFNNGNYLENNLNLSLLLGKKINKQKNNELELKKPHQVIVSNKFLNSSMQYFKAEDSDLEGSEEENKKLNLQQLIGYKSSDLLLKYSCLNLSKHQKIIFIQLFLTNMFLHSRSNQGEMTYEDKVSIFIRTIRQFLLLRQQFQDNN